MFKTEVFDKVKHIMNELEPYLVDSTHTIEHIQKNPNKRKIIELFYKHKGRNLASLKIFYESFSMYRYGITNFKLSIMSPRSKLDVRAVYESTFKFSSIYNIIDRIHGDAANLISVKTLNVMYYEKAFKAMQDAFPITSVSESDDYIKISFLNDNDLLADINVNKSNEYKFIIHFYGHNGMKTFYSENYELVGEDFFMSHINNYIEDMKSTEKEDDFYELVEYLLNYFDFNDRKIKEKKSVNLTPKKEIGDVRGTLLCKTKNNLISSYVLILEDKRFIKNNFISKTFTSGYKLKEIKSFFNKRLLKEETEITSSQDTKLIPEVDY